MSDKIGEQHTVHLSELDEYLASQLIDDQNPPLSLSISTHNSQGNINIQKNSNADKIEEGGIDFELSPSEYQSLDSINILDFTKSTIYTSSAYEFFDFILMYFSEVDCLLDFNGSSWRVRIISFKEIGE